MSTNIVAGSTPTDFETATSHTITVRETLAGASNSPRDTVLTINVTDVAEGGSDTTPNAFTFTDQTGVALSTPITSNTITVSGIDTASPLTITGGQYSINGGAFASTPTTVVNGNTVAVKATSSGSNSTAVNVVLTIGGVSDTFTITTLASGGTWTPANLSGTVHFFSAPLAVTQSGGIVSAVPDRNGGANWLPSGLGDDGAGTQPLSYGATAFGGEPGFTTLGGRGLRYAGVTGSSAVWAFFAMLKLDSTYAVGKRVWSAAPSGGFQDFGVTGAAISSAGGGANFGVSVQQDAAAVVQGLMSYDAIHTLIVTCSGSSVSMYVDGVLATNDPGSVNPGTPATAPWTLASTVNIGCFIRGEGQDSNANGAKGLFQSGGFKIGGTALNSTDIANLHAWMMDPV
jgi:hypothetical protein